MTDAKATFAVVLEDETSGAANSAASSLENLRDRIKEDTKALSEMRRAMRQMKQGGLGTSEVFKNLSQQVDGLKASIGQSQSAFASLGGTFGNVIPITAKAGLSMEDFAAAAAKGGGPIATMSGNLSRLGPLLSSSIAFTIAFAAAFVVLGVAIIATTAALVKFAIAESDLRRSEALQIKGLNTLRSQWGGATASVAEFQAAIDRASDSTNIGRSTLQTYARQLSRVGLRGDALTESVEAMGIAAQVQGDRGARRFLALAFNTRLAGGSVAKLAEQYRNRLGPIARQQMLSIGNQTDRLRSSLSLLFDGLRIERFLQGLDDVFDLLSQSTAEGRALKTVVEKLFQPLIDGVASAAPIVKAFMQGMIIGFLIFTIVLQRVKNKLEDIFGESSFIESFGFAKAAVFAGIVVFGALAVVLGFVALGFASVAIAIIATMLPFIALIALVFAAKNMIDGLIKGIRAGTPRLVAAIKSLAKQAADTFRSVLGISSPSSVFADFGMNIAVGTQKGIEAGAPDVTNTVSSLVDAPKGGGLGGTTSISIGDVNINAAETNDPSELATQFRAKLAELLEGVNVELGAAK